MKAIVFGGSGFLGSHVADELSNRGYDVIIYDLVASPYLMNDQQMVVGDILDSEQVRKAVAGCNYVFNFAGIADLDDATTKPLKTVELNIKGNLNIMEACLAANIQRYVYASTIYVYSQKGGFYRCSKQASELYIEEFQRRYGLDYTILRYGTLYGPRADASNSIYRYIKQALETSDINCSGTGEEMRDYIHVRDASRLSVDILGDEYSNQHIILSGHHTMRFKDMLFMIKEILGKDLQINFGNQKNEDHYAYTPYSYTPKIGSKLVNHLYVDMGQGLLECLIEMDRKNQMPG
ncbi:MAG: NAD(P)-dependent oxidoreductase [Syntrophomonadaceae bacterium]|nr:NAD(P)-dependent oxidoreductase [Syntrophomonadaceae bacterium]